MNTKRYLTFRLGDNDFSNHMQFAAERLHEVWGDELKTCSLEKFHDAMSYLMAGEAMAKAVFDNNCRPDRTAASYFKYLEDAKISREPEAAHDDCDHGAVSIDLSTGYVWVH